MREPDTDSKMSADMGMHCPIYTSKKGWMSTSRECSQLSRCQFCHASLSSRKPAPPKSYSSCDSPGQLVNQVGTSRLCHCNRALDILPGGSCCRAGYYVDRGFVSPLLQFDFLLLLSPASSIHRYRFPVNGKPCPLNFISVSAAGEYNL